MSLGNKEASHLPPPLLPTSHISKSPPIIHDDCSGFMVIANDKCFFEITLLYNSIKIELKRSQDELLIRFLERLVININTRARKLSTKTKPNKKQKQSDLHVALPTETKVASSRSDCGAEESGKTNVSLGAHNSENVSPATSLPALITLADIKLLDENGMIISTSISAPAPPSNSSATLSLPAAPHDLKSVLPRISSLILGVAKLKVVRDPPKITNVNLSTTKPLASLPVVASVSASKNDESLFKFEWQRLPVTPELALRDILDNYHSYPILHTGQAYVPTDEDIGHVLLIKVSYRPVPLLFSMNQTSPVLPAPPRCWRHSRLEAFRTGSHCCSNHTQADSTLTGKLDGERRQFNGVRFDSPQGSSFPCRLRLGSFNLLADSYCRTKKAQDIIYPYCSSETMDSGNRLPVLCSEILELGCDILGLQECDNRIYQRCLRPLLKDRYNSRLKLKCGKAKEGSVTIYDKNLFKELEFLDFEFKKELLSNPIFGSIISQIAVKWPHFIADVLPHLTTICQITVLSTTHNKCCNHPHQQVSCEIKNGPMESHSQSNTKDDGNQPIIIIGNTHLFFHPFATHIRILQLYVMLDCMFRLRSKYLHRYPNRKVVVVLLGDLNTTPHSGAYELLSKGEILGKHEDWANGLKFVWRSDTNDEENSDDEKEEMLSDDDDEIDGEMESDCSKSGQQNCTDNNSKEKADESLDERIGCRSQPSVMEVPVVVNNVDDNNISAASNACPNDQGLDINLRNLIGESFEMMRDVYSTNPNPFTNYVNGFYGTLDHILVSDEYYKACAPARLLSPVSFSDIVEHRGLPSVQYPSDHIAIAAELTFKA